MRDKITVIFAVNSAAFQNGEPNIYALCFPFASSDQMSWLIFCSKMLEVSFLKIVESKVNRRKACVPFYCDFMEVITSVVFLQHTVVTSSYSYGVGIDQLQRCWSK